MPEMPRVEQGALVLHYRDLTRFADHYSRSKTQYRQLTG